MSRAMTHAVKCWPQYYDALVSNAKPIELRIGDRPYAVGDLFVAQEWNPQSEQYTGRQCIREITYVGRDLPGLQKWHVALGLRELDCDCGPGECSGPVGVRCALSEFVVDRSRDGARPSRSPGAGLLSSLVRPDVEAAPWVVEAIKRLEARIAWQPIETAPKDRSDFLGWECGAPGIYFRTHDTPDDAAIAHGTACYPTHWMPLTPPTKGEG